MRVLVTGAGGFIGRHCVRALRLRGHEVVAAGLPADAAFLPKDVVFVAHDLAAEALPPAFTAVDAVLHLAWPGLPNYGELFHFERNLPLQYRFLKAMRMAGIMHFLVVGTCFEYGMQEGELHEALPALPANPYAMAKDALRKFMVELQRREPFTLQWVRLFYLFGEGQNPKSLLAQLDQAIADGARSFRMSMGEQLRDYLPVEEVARRLALLIERPADGVFNCCSGKPVSIRRLVEERLRAHDVSMELELGHYPYSPFEPMAFWGSSRKLVSAIGEGE